MINKFRLLRFLILINGGLFYSFSLWSYTGTINQLKQEIIQRMARVEEFKFIKLKSQKLAVPAYLFGGTAAAYAHYVYWDLLREKGDTSFQPGS